jgi:hypothetical protein
MHEENERRILKEILHVLQKLYRHLTQPRTTHIGIRFGGFMATATELVGQSVIATAVPLEADGTTVTPGAVVSGQTWTISDATIATQTINADGTATYTALAAGTATVTVVGSVKDLDGTTSSFTGTGTLTVTAPTGRTASLSVSFGTPA